MGTSKSSTYLPKLTGALIETMLLLYFIAFVIRIFLKDIFFVILEVDQVYLRLCRCNPQINNFYMYQALAFDIYDFSIALFILIQVYKDASAAMDDDNLENLLTRSSMPPNNELNNSEQHGDKTLEE